MCVEVPPTCPLCPGLSPWEAFGPQVGGLALATEALQDMLLPLKW